MELVNLPEVIFPLIQSYLSHDDYHFLLNTSKNSFADLKKRSIYFVLNEESTKQYLTDKTFQSVILSKVENGWKQIIPACDYWNFLSIYNQQFHVIVVDFFLLYNLVLTNIVLFSLMLRIPVC